MMELITVMKMLSVLIHLDPSPVHALEDLKEMAKTAQVSKLKID